MRFRFRRGRVFAVARQPRRERLVVRVGRVLERDAARAQRLDRRVDVVGAERDVLDALAAVVDQVFLDLALVVGALVDRDADLAAGARHRLALEAGQLALDVEVADLAEVEQPLVEARPLVHPAAMHVVRQVVDVGEAGAGRVLVDAGQRHEVDVVDRHAGAVVRRIAVDEVDQRVADALDRRDVELHRPRMRLDAPGAVRDALRDTPARHPSRETRSRRCSGRARARTIARTSAARR